MFVQNHHGYLVQSIAMQTLPAVHATLGVISKTMTIFLLKANNFYAEFSVSPSSINLIAGLDRTRITKPKEIALSIMGEVIKVKNEFL